MSPRSPAKVDISLMELVDRIWSVALMRHGRTREKGEKDDREGVNFLFIYSTARSISMLGQFECMQQLGYSNDGIVDPTINLVSQDIFDHRVL
jgi:hypothetical protein